MDDTVKILFGVAVMIIFAVSKAIQARKEQPAQKSDLESRPLQTRPPREPQIRMARPRVTRPTREPRPVRVEVARSESAPAWEEPGRVETRQAPPPLAPEPKPVARSPLDVLMQELRRQIEPERPPAKPAPPPAPQPLKPAQRPAPAQPQRRQMSQAPRAPQPPQRLVRQELVRKGPAGAVEAPTQRDAPPRGRATRCVQPRRRFLRCPEDLRHAIILREVFGPPLGLQ